MQINKKTMVKVGSTILGVLVFLLGTSYFETEQTMISKAIVLASIATLLLVELGMRRLFDKNIKVMEVLTGTVSLVLFIGAASALFGFGLPAVLVTNMDFVVVVGALLFIAQVWLE